jgi:hypothetical protein
MKMNSCEIVRSRQEGLSASDLVLYYTKKKIKKTNKYGAAISV